MKNNSQTNRNKMKTFKHYLITIVITVVTFTSCSSPEENNYVGDWNNSYVNIHIERQGDNLMVTGDCNCESPTTHGKVVIGGVYTKKINKYNNQPYFANSDETIELSYRFSNNEKRIAVGGSGVFGFTIFKKEEGK